MDLLCTGFALQGTCYVKVTNTLRSNIDSFVSVYNFYYRQTYARTKPLLIWDIHIAWWNLINHSTTYRENFKGDISWWGWAGGGENLQRRQRWVGVEKIFKWEMRLPRVGMGEDTHRTNLCMYSTIQYIPGSQAHWPVLSGNPSVSEIKGSSVFIFLVCLTIYL